jgi:hypothetical protein
MKTYSRICFLFFLILLSGCLDDQSQLKKGDALVVINVATRGSYQFLIQFENKLYYPKDLPEIFKVIGQHPIQVSIIFKLTGEQRDIFTPAPNDVPIFFKAIPEIDVIEIDKR